MRLFLSTFLVLAFLWPASAEARKAAARLAECDRDARAATFRGEMRPLRRGPGMEMKFLLAVREPGESWRRLRNVEGFGEWQAADPGRAGFIVDKRVERIVPDLSLRAIIRFRWRDDAGRVVARALRVTQACRQPDPRPNLVAGRIVAHEGARPDTLRYTVRVLNDGERAAAPFAVRVEAGAQSAVRSTTQPLAAGDEAVLEIEGPRCMPGTSVTVRVDSGGRVDEADETDNAVTVPCDTGVTGRHARSLESVSR